MIDQTSQFFAILTNIGTAKQANADAQGIAWKITQMGVGDANGTDPIPSAAQTMLINERRLNMMNAEDRKFLQEEMDKFLSGQDYARAEGYIPPDA